MELNLGGSKKKSSHVKKKHCIITLDLFKPTKKSYSEFDYEQICKQYLNEDDSSGEDERFHDREAEQLVKRLEQKYGDKVDKRGRKIRFGCAEDYMDKSAGYDLSDPFIDDTEAYDEHVPSVLDFAKGGFYVNRGKLEFKSKYADDDSDSDMDIGPKINKNKVAEKRRRISSDEEAQPSPSIVENKSKCEENCVIETASLPSTSAQKPQEHSSNTQNLIKRRRLMGQPPTAKIARSLTVKAALGVKKKLKPQTKKSLGMSTDELAGFLKDMIGGEEVQMDEGMDKVMREVTRESDENSAQTKSINEDKREDRASNEVDKLSSSADVRSSSESNDKSDTTLKRNPGRPPGSSSQLKSLPPLSEKLRMMIETYKTRTKEYGAPFKKIRLPTSLVDLCCRIEDQCRRENYNHQQRTRIFDILAEWVCVQRNSLYIRMKTYKDKPEAIRSSNTGRPEIPSSKSQSSLSSSFSMDQRDLQPKDPSAAVDKETVTRKEREAMSVRKDVSITDTAQIIPTKPSASASPSKIMPSAPESVIRKEDTQKIKNQNEIASGQSAALTSQNSSIHKQINSQSTAPNNTHLMSMLTSLLQQTRLDHQQQRAFESLASAQQMNVATLLNVKQQAELFAQYQLALSNAAKVAITSPSKLSAHKPPLTKAQCKEVAPKPATDSQQNQTAVTRSQSSDLLNAKQTEEAGKALREINDSHAVLKQAVNEARKVVEIEYSKEKIKCVKESLPVPNKTFRWNNSVRTALKNLINILYTNLEKHGEPPNIINPTVVRYLFLNVRPIFMDMISFKNLVLEILHLCPERKQLASIPEMKAYMDHENSSTSNISKTSPQKTNARSVDESVSNESKSPIMSPTAVSDKIKRTENPNTTKINPIETVERLQEPSQPSVISSMSHHSSSSSVNQMSTAPVHQKKLDWEIQIVGESAPAKDSKHEQHLNPKKDEETVKQLGKEEKSFREDTAEKTELSVVVETKRKAFDSKVPIVSTSTNTASSRPQQAAIHLPSNNVIQPTWFPSSSTSSNFPQTQHKIANERRTQLDYRDCHSQALLHTDRNRPRIRAGKDPSPQLWPERNSNSASLTTSAVSTSSHQHAPVRQPEITSSAQHKPVKLESGSKMSASVNQSSVASRPSPSASSVAYSSRNALEKQQLNALTQSAFTYARASQNRSAYIPYQSPTPSTSSCGSNYMFSGSVHSSLANVAGHSTPDMVQYSTANYISYPSSTSTVATSSPHQFDQSLAQSYRQMSADAIHSAFSPLNATANHMHQYQQRQEQHQRLLRNQDQAQHQQQQFLLQQQQQRSVPYNESHQYHQQ